MEGVTVLVIEDEIDLRDAIVSFLNLEDAFAVGVGNLQDAQKWLTKNSPDVVVLDLNLDGDDGMEWLRSNPFSDDVSVIIASARGEVIDRVQGFKLGIDSYLIKPIALEELVAIILNLQHKKQTLLPSIEQAEWTLNTLDWSLKNKHFSEPVKLTKLEEMVVNRLAIMPGQAVSKKELIIALNKKEDSYDLRSLEVLIRRLRQKIEPLSGDRTKPIKTIHSIGYSFIEPIKII
ncbi:response regulator transcription factor [Thiomicrorhabdus sp. Kp2]|uniref:response regulator transcription factor n=1 Tax=Thiomicrorhabdus sp. Kp2 TaxID=1123518 RepID=UPI0003F507D5|nr:response regulator transcription factor [Thiomicrorhabdus sp. Kp2]